MNDFLKDEIQKCKNANKIIIGLSGGADSIVLTHILFNNISKEKIICAHVNHQIRGEEADRDQSFVEKFCEENELRLEILQKNVKSLAKEMKIGTEECGRIVRYQFFQSLVTSKEDLIVTAHNADDNAETIILNLTRGAGLNGFSGIKKSHNNVYRPILKLSRKEIEDYCKNNCLEYVTDSSNLGIEYTRNIIRHKVIPVLKDVNENFIGNVNRSVETLTDDVDFLDTEVKKAKASAQTEFGLNTKILNTYHIAIKKRVLINFLKENGCKNIEKKHIDLILNAIESGTSVNVPPKSLVNIKQNILTVTSVDKVKIPQIPVCYPKTELPNGKILVLEEKKSQDCNKIHNLLFKNFFDYDKINNSLTIGSRCDGDKFQLPKRNITKTIKKLFNELKIPSALRDDILILKDGEKVVFIEGVGVSSEYQITSQTKKIIEIIIHGEKKGKMDYE